jgi:hypothetical protein
MYKLKLFFHSFLKGIIWSHVIFLCFKIYHSPKMFLINLLLTINNFDLFIQILVVILICLLFYHTVEDVYLLYVQKVPPGPVSLPLIGGLYKLDPYKPHVKLQQLIQEYGEIMSFRFGTSRKRSVIIHNTKLVEQVSTVKLAHAVTSIKQSPVFNGHLFLSCHRNLYALNLF